MALTFTAPRSTIEPSFWEELYQQKLNNYKLTKTHIPLAAQKLYSDGINQGSVHFSKAMFEEKGDLPGTLILLNTIEDFRDINKLSLIQEEGIRMLRELAASPSPAHLHKYIFLCFADLKNYNFTYWMALPAIVPKDQLVLSCAATPEPPVSLPSLYAHLAAAATAEDAAPRVLDVFYTLDGALFPVQAEVGIPGAAHALVVCVRDDGAASHV
eukprot:gene51432-62898_t